MGSGLADELTASIRLLVVADRTFAGDDSAWLDGIEAAAAAAQGLSVAIQVRAKALRGRALEIAAHAARQRVPAGVHLFLNGPAPIAALLGYDGVHWPESAIPSAPAAQRPAIASAAVHGLEALWRAKRAGADLVVFGSVYDPRSKAGRGTGIEALRAVARAASVPVVAIGGITPERAAACLDAGASAVATVSGVMGAPDPAVAIRAYLDALESAQKR